MTKHFTNTDNPIDFPKLSIIDQLWGETLDRIVPDTYTNLTLEQVENIKTLFAEKIVRECASLADNCPADYLLQPYKSNSTYIKETFGFKK